MASRRVKAALVLGGVLGVAAAAAGPLVRYQAERVASRYGAQIDIESVRPTWHGVALKGVSLTFPEIPTARVRLDEADVAVGFGGRAVSLRGGKITVIGPRGVLLQQVEAWRANHRGATAQQAETENAAPASQPFDVAGIDLAWRDEEDHPTESVRAKNVKFARGDGTVTVFADEAELGIGASSIAIRNGRVSLAHQKAGGYRVGALSAGAVDAEISLPGGAPASAEKSAPKEPSGGGSKAPTVALGERDAEAQETPARGQALQRKLMAAAKSIDAALDSEAKIELSGMNARILRGAEALHLGPGDLSVKRDQGKLLIELTPGRAVIGASSGEPSQQALTFQLSVPLDEGAGREIEADVRGGPIWLSTLGIREGDFGLFDVARASLVTRSHVVLSADGRDVRVDGEGKAQNLAIRSDALSEEPIEGLDVSWRAKAKLALDGSRLQVDQGEVDLGAIQLSAHGLYEKVGSSHKLRADFDVPLTACQSMLSSIPRGLAPKLQGMKMAGSFALRGKAQIDTARLDRDFMLDWDTSSSCRVTEAPPDLQVDRFRKPFRRVAFGVDGERAEIESGPQSAGWVPYGGISKFMEVAVLTTEDGGFFRHNGFDHEAIKNSIRENLRKRRFFRGASTVSMQLAKNLYLDKTKNLSRKLQEAVLTMYIEQELTKEQIMELYLNVIEFGPMVYGIGHAARFYFNTSASELSLAQSLYISSILPNPKVQHFAAGGVIAEGWKAYLKKLMVMAHDRNRISDEELEEGLREVVVRGSPAPRLGPADEAGRAPDDPDRRDVEPPEEPSDQ